ncbi:MAG: PEP-CTERM sorting domain-containing protein [Opitutaceae bacterium]|jgi:hypothetical protein
MKKNTIPGLLLAVTCLLGAANARADYTDNLLAGWTFNNGTLTSDLGTLSGGSAVTFSQTGTGGNQTTTFNSVGTVSLGTGRMLYTTAINSTDYPSLLSGVTIWVRVQFDATLAQTGIFGLLNTASALTGAAGVNNYSAALTVNDPTNRVGAFQGRTASSTPLGASSGNPVIPASGFSDIAIRVSDSDPALGSLVSVTINGVTKSLGWSGGSDDLQSFAALALGRIKTDAGTALTFDEVRLYSAYLTDMQLASISAVAIPEPGTVALVLGAAALVFSLKRRVRRS